MLSKQEKALFADMTSQLDILRQELAKEQKNNKRLIEMCTRHEAQLGRLQAEENDADRWKKEFEEMYFVDFHETALSIFSYKNLTETPRNFFNSKLLERQILDCAPVVVFEWTYSFSTPGGNLVQEKCPLALPFVQTEGVLDVYGGSPIVKPYPVGGTPQNSEYPELVVGENCVVWSDFYDYSQTNGNSSRTVSHVIRLFAELLADIEVAQRVNRNQIKIPFLFSADETTNSNEINKMIAEVNSIMRAVKDNSSALVSRYIKNMKVVNTGSQYYGEELQKAKRDAINALYNFLGIGQIKNENKARKITAEFEKVADEYNINITKRLQLRQKSLDECKRIFPQWFPANVEIEVNLAGYSTDDQEEESNNDSPPDNND